MPEIFHYQDGELAAGGFRLADVVEHVPTPFYVYALPALVERYRSLERAFQGAPHLHCVAMKANSQPALLRPLASEGAGAEVVSGAELLLARKLGFDPGKIVFSGVGKTEAELRSGLESDIRMFLVESETELQVLDQMAAEVGRKARVALRLNPDIDPETHPHIATGVSAAKFGVDVATARKAFERRADFPHLELAGIHSHIGSQITTLGPLEENARVLAGLIEELRRDRVPIHYVDIGGGLGVAYDDETPPSFDAYAACVLGQLRGLGVELVTEPGRALLAPVGAFVVRVLYVKEVHGHRFAVVDAGLNDLIRPALYGAYHRVVPLTEPRPDAPRAKIEVVGAVCESSDVFARDRELPELSRGDYLAILDTGAYGFVMSSNYNLRPQPAEVVLDGGGFRVVRPAETVEELVGRELGGAE